MAVTLRDVAERAGVSVKTVSNVVNDYAHITPATRGKVQRAIDELGYRPNLSARQLKYGRSGFLALALPHLDSPYFSELASLFSAAATERGFIPLLDITGADLAAERQVLAGVQSHMIDAVVFSPLTLTADEIAARRSRVPMVLLGERAIPDGYDHVAVDSVSAAEAVVEHLLSLGRRRIAAIGRESAQGTASVRLDGYLAALERAGVAVDESLVVGVPNYERSAGYDGMRQLLALPEPPDAVFCFNDLLAIGAMRAAADAGVRVPDDVAVAGFDDIAEGRYSTPRLTTVRPDMRLLVDEVLRLLKRLIEREPGGVEDVVIPWTLEVRESTAGGADA
ncbi:MAG: LacI family transcriptional regulator [Propionibacterium sp.]|nr:LacI family transcriptional regulator [Propionibacterium sp.]